MKYKILLIIYIILLPTLCYGTQQIADKLIIDGVLHPVHGFELTEKMFNHFHSKHPERFSSANWDGFYAKLTLKKKKLIILKLSAQTWPDMKVLSTEEAFGVTIPKNGLFAHWFSGTLTEKYGEELYFWSSHLRLYHFKNGILVNVEEKEDEEYNKLKKEIEKDKKKKQ